MQSFGTQYSSGISISTSSRLRSLSFPAGAPFRKSSTACRPFTRWLLMQIWKARPEDVSWLSLSKRRGELSVQYSQSAVPLSSTVKLKVPSFLRMWRKAEGAQSISMRWPLATAVMGAARQQLFAKGKEWVEAQEMGERMARSQSTFLALSHEQLLSNSMQQTPLFCKIRLCANSPPTFSKEIGVHPVCYLLSWSPSRLILTLTSRSSTLSRRQNSEKSSMHSKYRRAVLPRSMWMRSGRAEGKGERVSSGQPTTLLKLVFSSISLSHSDFSSSSSTSRVLPILRATWRKSTNSSVRAKRTDSPTALKHSTSTCAAPPALSWQCRQQQRKAASISSRSSPGLSSPTRQSTIRKTALRRALKLPACLTANSSSRLLQRHSSWERSAREAGRWWLLAMALKSVLGRRRARKERRWAVAKGTFALASLKLICSISASLAFLFRRSRSSPSAMQSMNATSISWLLSPGIETTLFKNSSSETSGAYLSQIHSSKMPLHSGSSWSVALAAAVEVRYCSLRASEEKAPGRAEKQ